METRRLTKRGTERREQVMEAATRLFAEAGYHGTTVGDVCDYLGVGKGVFYWYFESKQALFRELLNDALYRLRRTQEDAIEGVRDPVERLERGIRASIEFFRVDPSLLSVIRIAQRLEDFQSLVTQGQEIVVADTATHVKDGMSDGSIRHGDAELMAHGILGATFHFVETYFGAYGDATGDRPELAEEAVAFCLSGLLKR